MSLLTHRVQNQPFEWLHCLGSSTFARCRRERARLQRSGAVCTVASRPHLVSWTTKISLFSRKGKSIPSDNNICFATQFNFSLIHLAQCACIIAFPRLNLALGARTWTQTWLLSPERVVRNPRIICVHSSLSKRMVKYMFSARATEILGSFMIWVGWFCLVHCWISL